LPDRPQPAQKAFDTALVSVLSRFDVQRPVFVEAESRRIGAITLPQTLLERFHGGACVEVEATHADRITFLLQDYAHLFDNPDSFKYQLDRLIGLHSREQVKHWQQLIDAGNGLTADGAGSAGAAAARAELFGELIERHYDPAYQRSSRQHFSRLGEALHFSFRPNAADSVGQAAALLSSLAPAGGKADGKASGKALAGPPQGAAEAAHVPAATAVAPAATAGLPDGMEERPVPVKPQ
jgi:tRNA 2-selenouridine synthase